MTATVKFKNVFSCARSKMFLVFCLYRLKTQENITKRNHNFRLSRVCSWFGLFVVNNYIEKVINPSFVFVLFFVEIFSRQEAGLSFFELISNLP